MTIAKGYTGSTQSPAGTTEEQFFEVPEGARAPTTLMVRGTGTGTLRLVSQKGALFPTGNNGTPLDLAEGPHFFRVDHGGITSAFWKGAGTDSLSWGPMAWTQQ